MKKKTRRNLFGWGGGKPEYKRRKASLSIGQAARGAFAAGKRLGDMGYFPTWLERTGLDGRGDAVRRRLQARFEEGIEARSLPGKKRSGSRAMKPAAATHRPRATARTAGGGDQREKALKAAVKRAEKNLEDAQKQLGAAARKGNRQAQTIIGQYERELKDIRNRSASNPRRNPAKQTFRLTKEQAEDLALAAIGGGVAAPLARKLLANPERKRAVMAKRNPGKPGSAFERCVSKVAAKGGAFDPKAVCAASARRKYGEKKLEAMQKAGRRRAARRRNPRTTVKTPKTPYALELNGKRRTVRTNSEESTVRAFGLTEPRRATMTRNVRTKLGLAFTKGQEVTVYKGDVIETGPYAGQQSYSAWSKRNDVMTAIRPSSFRFTGRQTPRNPTVKIGSRKVKVSRAGARVIRRLVAHDRLKKNGRRNPESEAIEMYRMFHGTDADEKIPMVEYITEEHEHSILWGAGDLVRITVITPRGKEHDIDVGPVPRGEKFPDPANLAMADRVVLAASEDGRQLYLVSGDQELDLDRLGLKEEDIRDNMVIGVIRSLVYQTRKDFHKFELTNYTHKLGEESGVQPVLVYHPQTPQMEIAGGRYRIERPGIID